MVRGSDLNVQRAEGMHQAQRSCCRVQLQWACQGQGCSQNMVRGYTWPANSAINSFLLKPPGSSFDRYGGEK
jgi:hypothetical protein